MHQDSLEDCQKLLDEKRRTVFLPAPHCGQPSIFRNGTGYRYSLSISVGYVLRFSIIHQGNSFAELEDVHSLPGHGRVWRVRLRSLEATSRQSGLQKPGERQSKEHGETAIQEEAWQHAKTAEVISVNRFFLWIIGTKKVGFDKSSISTKFGLRSEHSL